MGNRFVGAEDVPALLHQLAGAASVCWENVRAAGVFQSDQAKQACEEALERLKVLSRSEGIHILNEAEGLIMGPFSTDSDAALARAMATNGNWRKGKHLTKVQLDEWLLKESPSRHLHSDQS